MRAEVNQFVISSGTQQAIKNYIDFIIVKII